MARAGGCSKNAIDRLIDEKMSYHHLNALCLINVLAGEVMCYFKCPAAFIRT